MSSKNKYSYNIFNALKNKITKSAGKIIISRKLEQWLKNNRTGFFENFKIHEIRKKTLKYIEHQRLKESPYGQFRYSESQTKPVLYASLYAALIRSLYRDLDNLSDIQKKEWINYIQSFQSEDDGLFKDNIINNELAADSDWWGWRHLTLHALMALTALGAAAEKKIKIIEPFKDIKYTLNWLEERDWVISPADTSNEVQNYISMLQYIRDFHHEDWANKSLEKIYTFLNKIQDPKTGLWGVRFDNPLYLSLGVQTGYHLWLLYFYDRKPVQYMERIIDSCLFTQNKFGGFGVQKNSSACEDIDSIDPLARLSCFTDYRKKDIQLGLQKALLWIFANMNEDGGFVFRRMEPFTYGHYLMSSGKDESAMFPTWFRTLSLAYIGKCMPDSLPGNFDWQFINCPGLTFWRK
ncbi:hypothetical protein HY745_13755 [Candidatus Desantisbacteria bacterium]|nr:hypothetical protein [Candidatus Desantisbacteria bacterium]